MDFTFIIYLFLSLFLIILHNPSKLLDRLYQSQKRVKQESLIQLLYEELLSIYEAMSWFLGWL